MCSLAISVDDIYIGMDGFGIAFPVKTQTFKKGDAGHIFRVDERHDIQSRMPGLDSRDH